MHEPALPPEVPLTGLTAFLRQSFEFHKCRFSREHTAFQKLSLGRPGHSFSATRLPGKVRGV